MENKIKCEICEKKEIYFKIFKTDRFFVKKMMVCSDCLGKFWERNVDFFKRLDKKNLFNNKGSEYISRKDYTSGFNNFCDRKTRLQKSENEFVVFV